MKSTLHVSSCAALLALSLGTGSAVRAQDSSTTATTSNTTGTASTKHINISLTNQPISTALSQLFDQAGVSFTITSAANNSITVNLKDMPFDTALNSILQAGNNQLTYTVSNGVYRIVPKMDMPTAPANPNYDTISLSYVNAQTVLDKIRALNGGSANSSYGSSGYGSGYSSTASLSGTTDYTSGGVGGTYGNSGYRNSTGFPEGVDSVVTNEQNNSLVVRSTPEGLERLRNVVKLFDVPMTAPRNLARPANPNDLSNPLGGYTSPSSSSLTPSTSLDYPSATVRPVQPSRSRTTRAMKPRVPVRTPKAITPNSSTDMTP